MIGFSLRDNILITVSHNTDCCCYLGSSAWGWFRWWSQRSGRRAWYHGDSTTRGHQYTHPRDTHPTGRWISTRHAARQNNKPLCGIIVVVFHNSQMLVARYYFGIVMAFCLRWTLTLSLLEQVMALLFVIFTLKSGGKILWCHHSNESSLTQRLHGIIYIFASCSKGLWMFRELFLLPPFGIKG